MFLKFSEEDILKFRSEKFPDLSSFIIKNAIFKTSGTDTIADVEIQVEDSLANPKIFKNLKSKNTLKLKIFEIVNEDMKLEVSSCTNSISLQEIISKYGALSNDLFPCVDFIGDKNDSTNHVIEDGNITLKYKTRFVFPEQETYFLSFGAIFFFNLEDYLKEVNISEKYITKELLCSSIKIADMFNTSGKNINPDVVQDLRALNKVFKSNEVLEKINEIINFDYKATKILSQPEKEQKSDQFFSSPYFSRSSNGNLNLLFFVDYKKIIEKNSNFKDLIKNTEFPSDVIEKCKISSIKIVRREVEYDNTRNKRVIIKKTPVESIISTSQELAGISKLFVKSNENDSGIIRELNFSNNFRTFEIVDKKVYKNKNSYYQYGVEISVQDGFYGFLDNIRKKLIDNLQIFKSYLNETNNFVKPISDKKNVSVGYYDPLNQAFTKKFAEEIFPSIYEKNILNSVSYLIGTMKIFGLVQSADQQKTIIKNNTKLSSSIIQKRIEQNPPIKNIVKNRKNLTFALKGSSNKKNVLPQETQEVKNTFKAVQVTVPNKNINIAQDEELLSSLIALLSPSSASDSTIQYFIKIYEKLINQINRVLQDSSNTVFDVNYWFEKEVVDASENPAIGYGFFDDPPDVGLNRINNLNFETKIEKDIIEYYKNSSLPQNKLEYKYYSVAPQFIFSKNKKLKLNDIKNIDKEEFIDLELDIKRYNSLGTTEKDFLFDTSADSLSIQKQANKLKTQQLANKFSFGINNLLQKTSDFKKILANGNQTGILLNNEVNPELLFLAMLKNSDKKPVFKPFKESVKLFRSTGVLLPQKTTIPQNLPFQIQSLFDKTDPFFSESGAKYLTDLNQNSKFLLLFNTIHVIEILQKNTNNVKDEIWVPLTASVYESLRPNSQTICRLKKFVDKNLHIDSFEEISLPIYDKYFILSKTFADSTVDFYLERYRSSLLFSMLKTKEKILFNTLPRTLKIFSPTTLSLNLSDLKKSEITSRAVVTKTAANAVTSVNNKTTIRPSSKTIFDVPTINKNYDSKVNKVGLSEVLKALNLETKETLKPSLPIIPKLGNKIAKPFEQKLEIPKSLELVGPESLSVSASDKKLGAVIQQIASSINPLENSKTNLEKINNLLIEKATLEGVKDSSSFKKEENNSLETINKFNVFQGNNIEKPLTLKDALLKNKK